MVTGRAHGHLRGSLLTAPANSCHVGRWTPVTDGYLKLSQEAAGSWLRAQALELVAVGHSLALSRCGTLQKSLSLSVPPSFHSEKGKGNHTVMRVNAQTPWQNSIWARQKRCESLTPKAHGHGRQAGPW